MTEDYQGPRKDRDEVAALLRMAGKRPTVPRDRMERARAAARRRWQDGVTTRQQRIFRVRVGLLVAAASIAVVAAVWIIDFGKDSLSGNAGVAWIEASVGSTGVEADTQANSGDVFTTGEDGQLALRFDSGHSVRIDFSSRVVILNERTLALDRGAIYVDSGSLGGERNSLEIQTPLGTIHETGTQYEVRIEDGLVRVRLREGSVVVRHDGHSSEVAAGNELLIRADGSATWSEYSIHGQDWDWFSDITPVPDFDGEIARTFLDWVARERGLQLVFVDEDVSLAADSIILGGSFRNLTLAQGLDAVLPTCRLTYDIQGGTLMIDTE